MEVIQTERHRLPSKDELKLFLGACRDAARDDDHYKIASITLKTRSLDPLAVLESIYERDEFHFYLEQPSADFALAGAEAVVLGTFAGGDRVGSVKAWSAEVLEHTVAVGDLDAAMAGPHFYLGLGFEESTQPDAPFAPATVFLPRWQVAKTGDATTAVANFRVDPESDLDTLVEKLWAAYEKFNRFADSETPHPAAAKLLSQAEVGQGADFEERVRSGLDAIERGEVDKVVLARAIDAVFDRPFRPLVTLAGLRERFSTCYAFSFENDRGQSFIGATPELLCRVAGGGLYTEALAGTAPRGRGAREDAQIAQGLRGSAKDLREHAHVVDSIRRRLDTLGIELKPTSSPHVQTLPNVHHLKTPLEGTLPEGKHLLDVLAQLHPTPAVGGTPREVALPLISGLEPFKRGLYAGALGYFDHKGEGAFCVGLRAGLVDGAKARLFAGAGIVAGSEPEAEWRETEMKFAALREAIAGE